MSVKDVIKNSVIDAIGGGSALSTGTVVIIVVMACLMGIYIFAVYKLSAKSAFYSKDLNITLAGLPLIVAAIMIAMQSNLLVSLGMVGALSIVRFRNAVKNPIDLLYLFWSISVGIIVGIGLYLLGVVLSILMTVLLLILDIVPNGKAPELLILRSADKKMDYDALYKEIKNNCRYYKEKARCVKNGEVELIIEVRMKNKEELLDTLSHMKALTQVNCLAHDGECRV